MQSNITILLPAREKKGQVSSLWNKKAAESCPLSLSLSVPIALNILLTILHFAATLHIFEITNFTYPSMINTT